jgi:protein-S-isoprenylcysteine O-methyltransferase Ste14
VLNLVADAVAAICVVALFGAIACNFIASAPHQRFREKRSPVATASMTLFFVLLYGTIRLRWGALTVDTGAITVLRLAGLTLMLFGAGYNIWGRLYLKNNWADHVRIYDDHTLITTGPYRWVRHPLYASLIWMFYGAALAYLNPLAAIETALIFIPAMHYRSNQEERALAATFQQRYTAYRQRTGRFFPLGRLAP